MQRNGADGSPFDELSCTVEPQMRSKESALLAATLLAGLIYVSNSSLTLPVGDKNRRKNPHDPRSPVPQSLEILYKGSTIHRHLFSAAYSRLVAQISP